MLLFVNFLDSFFGGGGCTCILYLCSVLKRAGYVLKDYAVGTKS